jgi:hypothetical protein
VEPGRRGVEVRVTGALTVPAALAWDDVTVVMALLDADGAVLAVETGRPNLAEALGDTVLFSEYTRLAPFLADRVEVVHVWATALVIEVTATETLDVATALPPPAPGGRSVHTLGSMTLSRPCSSDDGEVRMTAYGRCSFDGVSTYDERAQLELQLLDPAGAVLFAEDGRIETHNGQNGDAYFEERFRPHTEQLDRAARLTARVVTRRRVATERASIVRASIVRIDAD